MISPSWKNNRAGIVKTVKCRHNKLYVDRLKQKFDEPNKVFDSGVVEVSPDKETSPRRGGSKGKLSAHHRGGTTESMEDYLEAIADIVKQQGFVRVSDVAERLEIRRASVSLMIKRLSEQGFLNHVPYRGFTLTGRGEEVAAQVKVRHETLEEFFGLLKLPEESLAKDVEGIEHHISPETLALLKGFIGFWKKHPSVAEDYAKHLRSAARKIKA